MLTHELKMVAILKQSFTFLLGALLLTTTFKGADAAARGIRGRQQEQSNFLTNSENTNIERGLKRGDKRKCKKCAQGTVSSVIDDLGVTGRFDLPVLNPSPTDAPVPPVPSLDTWINECSTENSDVDACAPRTNTNCKRCLYALSFTSATPATADSGVKACARDFCEMCTQEDIMPFFVCGYEVKNPPISDEIDPMIVDDPSVGTPAATNSTESSLQTPIFDETVVDLWNCPAVYPQNDTTCVMIEGFEFKKCMYYEVGDDVKCECSEDRPIWNCTGTITNEDYLTMTESLEAFSEEERKDVFRPLPAANIVASRIEVVAAEAGGL